MRARIPMTTLSRLIKLEGGRDVRVRRVMLVPPILPIDEWEILAVASQTTLALATHGADSFSLPREAPEP